MKNNYIKIIASSNNEFRTTMDIDINGQEYKSVNVKIDTGCPQTTILTSKLGISERSSKKMKADDINNGVKRKLSFGVNDSLKYRQEAQQKNRSNDVLDLSSVSFYKDINSITIDGVKLNQRTVAINYDRTGNILIGVDILKTLDIHIGTIDTGETIFLACPKDSINREYLDELEKLIEESADVSVSLII